VAENAIMSVMNLVLDLEKNHLDLQHLQLDVEILIVYQAKCVPLMAVAIQVKPAITAVFHPYGAAADLGSASLDLSAAEAAAAQSELTAAEIKSAADLELVV
jgi:hypothetical protein